MSFDQSKAGELEVIEEEDEEPEHETEQKRESGVQQEPETESEVEDDEEQEPEEEDHLEGDEEEHEDLQEEEATEDDEEEEHEEHDEEMEHDEEEHDESYEHDHERHGSIDYSPSDVDDTDESSKIPKTSILADLADEDAHEFDDGDMEDYLPQSKFKDKSFMKLREFYEGIMADLESAQRSGIPLEEVKDEFYFVWNAIQKSHENLDSLLQKDLQLSVEVADTMAKTRNLIRIAEDSPDKAFVLGRRLETAWNLVDISKAEERRNVSRLEELEEDITLLNKNIAAANNMEGKAELNELHNIRKKLSDERDSLKKEMVRMHTALKLLQEKKFRQADKKIEFHDQIKFAEEEAIAQTEALLREEARIEKLEQAITETAENIEIKADELADMERQMADANDKIEELEHAKRDQIVVNEVALRETEAAVSKQDKLKADVDGQIALVERLAGDAYKRQQELKTREDEITAIKMEGSRSESQRIANVKKCEAMQETLEALEGEREALRVKIQLLEKDLDKAQKKLSVSKREVEELDKQRTLVNRNLQRAAVVTGEHEGQMKMNVIAINNLEGELDGFRREVVTQTEMIKRLERERDYYSNEATELAHVVASRVDLIKRLDLSILEHKRRVGELEDSARSVNLAYEAVVIEKQHNERALRDVVNEITQCAKAIRNIKFEKYGQEYRETDLKNHIAAEEERRDGLEKETTFFKSEANRMKHMAVDISREVEALEGERSVLSAAIATGENEIAKQKYYATGAESRKLNYMRKLMLKEKELRETWEHWRTLHSMVRIGAYHYRNLMAEIRETRQEIVNLRQVQMSFTGNTNHVSQLRQEISVLENCIAKETCMVNALIDELKKPINIHRWRVLEAIDPDAYNLVKKINIVTKRVVDHSEQIRLQNLRLVHEEHVYVDIKGITKHLPGLETPEERLYYQVLYGAKKQQLEVLKYDMYGNEAQTAYFQGQTEILKKKMEDLKKAYFEQKKYEECRQNVEKQTKSCLVLFEKKKKEALLAKEAAAAKRKSKGRRSRLPPSLREEEGEGQDEEEEIIPSQELQRLSALAAEMSQQEQLMNLQNQMEQQMEEEEEEPALIEPIVDKEEEENDEEEEEAEEEDDPLWITPKDKPDITNVDNEE